MTTSTRSESGAILVITAMAISVLLGVAAFAVDYGWIAYNQLEARKTAEAGALAGVVHMPLPDCADPTSGTAAYDTAVDTAGRNGYSAANGDTVTPANGGSCARLKVTVSRGIPTFFMKVFGYSSVNVTESATAEQLPPLRLGSDEPSLGGASENFWVSLNGDRRRKQDGDPFATECYINNACSPAADSNNEFRPNPNYYYAVEVPATEAAKALTIQVYDGPHHDPRWQTPGAPGDRAGADDTAITFAVYEPDSTPSVWTDNSTLVPGCTFTFLNATDITDPGVEEWVTICTDSAIEGIYVIHVEIGCVAPCRASERDSITDFAMRSQIDGSSSNDTALYGLGAMSLDMVEVDTNPTFQLLDLLPVYAGAELGIGLFDAGDASGTADLTFGGSLATTDCLYRVRGGSSGQTLVQDWGADDTPGSAPCFLDTSGQRFNDQWLDFRFIVDAGYTCDPAVASGLANSCWLLVDYNFGGATSVTERTTWTATINGTPVHLLP